MKKIYKSLFALSLLFLSVTTHAQVSLYGFSQLSGTYTPIPVSGPSATAIAVGNYDDNIFTGIPIGFNFNFNNTTYTTIALNVNGWITFGTSSPFSSYTPISTGSAYDVVSFFGRDLQMGPAQTCTVTSGSNVINLAYPAASNFFSVGDTITGTGIPLNASVTAVSAGNMTISAAATGSTNLIYTKGAISYQLSGSAPNRVFTIQFKKFGRYNYQTTGLDDYFNAQIKLYETTNIVEIVYGSCGTNNTIQSTVEIGLRGQSNSDFNNRSVASGGLYSSSAAGTVNNASAAFDNLTSPASGQIYRWTPPPVCSGAPGANSVVASLTVVCPNGSANLSLANSYTNTGITYQWYAATAAAGPYTLVTGATSNTYMPTGINVPMWYEAVITCSAGPASTTATPIHIINGGNACQCNAYCVSNAGSVNDEEIFNVSIGTLNNTSNCSQTGGPGSIMNEYSNYSGIIAAPTLSAGATYTLAVTVGECNGNSYSAGLNAFIDFNNNGVFTDAGENVFTSTLTTIAVTGTTFTVSVPIPAAATPGITRMRVIAVESNVGTAPCAGYTWGETEDYCVNIAPGPPCAGAPGANSAVASSTNICPSTSVSLSLANSYTVGGLTYQWFSAPAASGPYTSITSATASIYTASSVTATTFYQAVITCTNGPASTTSTPVQVVVGGSPCQCATYCASNATSINDEEIFNVTIGTLNNTSSCSTLAGGPGSILKEYSNYAGMIAAPTLTAGYTYSLSVTVGECNGNSYSGMVTAYMDFNQNGVFTDAGELVYTSAYGPFAVTGTTFTTNVTLPVTATSGTTRMRVIAVESSLAQASCGTYSWGETEDYCINIVPPPPCTSASSGTLATASYSACAGQTVALNTTGATIGTGIVYQWQSSASSSGPFANVTGGSGASTTSYTTAPLTAGTTYYLLQTTCTLATLTAVSNQATVVVNPVPTAAASTIAAICAGQNVVFTSTTNIGTNFIWTGPNSFTSSAQNPTITNAPANASGNYTLLVSAAGCTSTPVVVTVTVNSTNLNIIASPPTLCLGGSSTLTASGNATTYVWSNSSTASSIVVTPASTTVYSLTGTGASNCTATAVVTITVNNPTITANGAQVCTVPGTGTLTATAFGPVNWYASPTSTTSLASGNSFVPPLASSTTTYYAEANSIATGSLFTTLAAGNGFAGNMFDLVAINNIAVNSFDMHFSSTGTATMEVWYRVGSFVGFESSNAGWTMAYTSTVNALGTGTLTPSPGTFTVNIPAGQTYGFYVTAVSSGPQVNYTNGTTLGNIYVQNPDLKLLEGKGGGYFSVVNSPRVFNGQVNYTKAGCLSPRVPAVLTVGAQPTITIGASQTSVCPGTSVNIGVTGANTYTWSTGATGALISPTVTTTTNYTVIGETAPGCAGTASITITTNTLPIVNVSSTSATLCTGNTASLTASGASSYSWSTGSTNTTIAVSPTITTTYTVTGTGANGCAKTTTVTQLVSTCTGIESKVASVSGILVYPNPNTGEFTIELNNGSTKNIQVMDVTGRVVLSNVTSKDKIDFNINTLANGVYYVKIQSDNAVETIRIIKE